MELKLLIMSMVFLLWTRYLISAAFSANQNNCFVSVICDDGPAWINFTAWNQEQLKKSINKKFSNVIEQMKAKVVTLKERLDRLQKARRDREIANQTTVGIPSTSNTVTTTSTIDTFGTEVPSSTTVLSSPTITRATENPGANPSSTAVLSSPSQTQTTEKPEGKAQVPFGNNCSEACQIWSSLKIPTSPNIRTAHIKINGKYEKVYCDCSDKDPEWLVIWQKGDGDLPHNPNFEVGFYDTNGNYWIDILRDLGCWKDTGDRAIPSIENRLVGNYQSRPNAIQQCAHAARILGYRVFAVQHGGWCASGPNAIKTYKKHGPYDKCNSDGKGGPWANQVYEIDTVMKENCTYNNCSSISTTSHTFCINENCTCDRSWLFKLMSDNIYRPDWDKTCKVPLGVSCSEACQNWAHTKALTYPIEMIAYIKIDGQYEKVHCKCSYKDSGWMVIWRKGLGVFNIPDYNETFEDENGFYWIGIDLIGRLTYQYNASILMIMKKGNYIKNYGFLSKELERSDVNLCIGSKCENLRSLIMSSSVNGYDVMQMKIMTPQVLCPVAYEDRCFFPFTEFTVECGGNDRTELCWSIGGHLANIYSQTHMNDVAKFVRDHRMSNNGGIYLLLGMRYQNGTLLLHNGTKANTDLKVMGGINYIVALTIAKDHSNLTSLSSASLCNTLCEIEKT